jgi:hypothetical protein
MPAKDETSALCPLDVLLAVMRMRWQEGDFEGAVAIARLAAPYLHPKCGSKSTKSKNLAELTDAELSLALASIDEGESIEAEHPDLVGGIRQDCA